MVEKKKWQSGKSGELKSGESTKFIKAKDRLVLLQLKTNPEGVRANSLSKLTNIPTRTIYRILKKYEGKGLVENIYPIWKPCNGQGEFWQTISKSGKIFELHNLSYTIQLIKKPDWWNKRKRRLMRLKNWQFSNHNFGKNNSNPYQQMLNEDYVIQTYPESINIIHRKRYYSDDPHKIINQGMIETLDILKFLEQRFRFNFFPSGIPCIKIRNNDFNRIGDYLARTCKREGTKFLVETEVGKVWVDYSEPFGKEADTPDIQEQLEKHTRDIIEKKPMLNSELQLVVSQTARQIQGVVNNQEIFDRNISLHQSVLEEIRDAIRELKREVKKSNEKN